MSRFKGKIALVTGAATGVGEGAAYELYQQGATVILAGRTLATLTEAALKIDPTSLRAIPMQVDVTEPESVKILIDNIMAQHGALHYLVNSAGITGPHDINLDQYEIEAFKSVIETNLYGTFYAMKYAIPAMLKSNGGAIVNLSAVNGLCGIAGISPYTASKHAVLGLTRATALEYATKGIRINAVAPGYVATPRIEELPGNVQESMSRSHPMKRMASREEVAKAIVFLLSDDSSFTTGTILPIDGGYTAQ